MSDVSVSSALAQAIADEQVVVDRAYRELDSQIAQARKTLSATEARGASGTHQARGERDAFAAHYANRIATLEGVEHRLVFGRMDNSDGSRHYVGRVGLHDDQRREVLLDWRAPAARAFYQATAREPLGLRRRRHITTRGRTVSGVEDELLMVDAAAASDVTLQGEGALMAALNEARAGRMGDIVATIQAEQDRIVTADGPGILVVQGGPGTGKTAVALHRVAYLFYTERERLERSGVLLVGPSRTFLRYVEQVLPSLGETGVVSTTIGDLVPGYHATVSEPSKLAQLKGSLVFKDILYSLARALQRVPQEPRPIVVNEVVLQLTPEDVRQARSRARRSGKPHNQARETFVLWLLERLTDQYAAKKEMLDPSDPDTRAWIREDIRTSRDARREINLCWMPTDAQALLDKLFSRPQLLDKHAKQLTKAQRKLLLRPAGSPLSEADIPLLDELLELLGPMDDVSARQARQAEAERARELEYAQQAIASQGLGGGMVSAQTLVDRYSGGGAIAPLAERARADRTWTYGHVVVDEAQELGAMAWRALARRCPLRSFTVVGDLAQFSGTTPPRSWRQVLAPLGVRADEAADIQAAKGASGTPMRQEVLTVCYRTPKTIMKAAEAAVASYGLQVPYPVTSVRDLDDALVVEAVTPQLYAQRWREVVTAKCGQLDEQLGKDQGTIVVISNDPARLEALLGEDEYLAEQMFCPEGDLLRARVAVMSPLTSKGLEFDVVLLDQPGQIGQVSPGDLYVAMTRPTKQLHILHTGKLGFSLQ